MCKGRSQNRIREGMKRGVESYYIKRLKEKRGETMAENRDVREDEKVVRETKEAMRYKLERMLGICVGAVKLSP